MTLEPDPDWIQDDWYKIGGLLLLRFVVSLYHLCRYHLCRIRGNRSGGAHQFYLNGCVVKQKRHADTLPPLSIRFSAFLPAKNGGQISDRKWWVEKSLRKGVRSDSETRTPFSFYASLMLSLRSTLNARLRWNDGPATLTSRCLGQTPILRFCLFSWRIGFIPDRSGHSHLSWYGFTLVTNMIKQMRSFVKRFLRLPRGNDHCSMIKSPFRNLAATDPSWMRDGASWSRVSFGSR